MARIITCINVGRELTVTTEAGIQAAVCVVAYQSEVEITAVIAIPSYQDFAVGLDSNA